MILTEQQEILRMLGEKKELLLQFETITEQMYTVPPEELERLIGKRQSALDKMQRLDERVSELCEGMDPAVREAVDNRCGRNGLEEGLAALYDAALETRAVANRILRNSDGVRERFEQEKEILLAKIQGVNASSAVVAGRYGRAMQTGVSRPFHGPGGMKI